MGRGRAKAKQVKVARRLKYNSVGTDLDRLREELGVGRGDSTHNRDYKDPYEELVDRYADYAREYEESRDDDRDEDERPARK